MAAFVDLINRTRRDHVITIEREINIVARTRQLVHQPARSARQRRRHAGGGARGAARGSRRAGDRGAAHRGADERRARRRRVRPAGRRRVLRPTPPRGAIDRIIDLYPPEQRRQVQMALADSLRGVIAQVLLRKIGGGRLPAREVLLNTPAVSSVIAEGKTSQLPMAIEGGRRHGMMPLNDALVGLVQSGSSTRTSLSPLDRSRRVPRRAEPPGHRHLVRRAPRWLETRARAVRRVSSLDERFELFQQKLQQLVLRSAPPARRSVALTRSRGRRAPRLRAADHRAARRRSCRATARCSLRRRGRTSA